MFDQQLEHWLTPFKTARQRAVFIFTPHNARERERILYELEHALPEPLWLSDSSERFVQMHRYRDYLGLTTSHVVLDFAQLVHADALAALAGTVNGGHCLWLVLPVTASHFQQRLLHHAAQFDAIVQCSSWQALLHRLAQPAPILAPAAPAPELPSNDQQNIITALLEHPSQTHVIIADRGRGKSTTLGLACQAWGASTHPILVTGPRPSALATLLEQAGSKAKFCAWDRLLREAKSTSAKGNEKQLLIIDEAAAIPLHCLKELFAHYQVWAVATTVDGYEGCGQGFVLRFLDWLSARYSIVQHHLSAPLRWAASDACERWLNGALLMTSRQRNSAATQTNGALETHLTHASQLTEDELAQTMTLLLEAHYQSSPNDLRLLLDDAEQRLLVARHGDNIVGVTWLAQEGPLPEHLQAPIMLGKRRVKGQLLPQALGFYRQQQNCLTWHWWRIVRIAVRQEQRRQRVGLQMLAAVTAHAQQHNIDAIGTSFSVTPAVEQFWTQTPLQEVRRGLKKNAASGTVSAVWAYGLDSEAQRTLAELASLQQAEIAWLQNTQAALSDDMIVAVHEHCLTILRGFCQGGLPFSNARFAWWFLSQQVKPKCGLTPETLLASTTMNELQRNNNAKSRADLETQLRQQALQFLQSFRP